jgi:hypothetical protein
VSCGPSHRVVVLACSTCDLMVVLTNPDPCTCRGGSCAGPEAALRVVMLAPASGRRPYADSRV